MKILSITLKQIKQDISKNDLWYVNYYSKCEKPSLIGYKTLAILTRLYNGMHHVPNTQIAKMDWTNKRFLSFKVRDSMATYDYDMLTHLVLLAHEYCVRVEINSCNFHYFEIMFFNRINRRGKYYERHPTIKKAGLTKIAEKTGFYPEVITQ